jgi:GNAT superfamily N-acetyltransferase
MRSRIWFLGARACEQWRPSQGQFAATLLPELTSMGNPVLRLLTVDDLDDAVRLSTIVGWNQRPDDWRILLQIARTTAFAAVIDEGLAATAIGIDYRRFWWIAMMLVNPSYRRHGLGRRLLEAAMAAAPANLPIRLDATALGRPLYLQYDFEDESSISRHVRNGKPAVGPDSGAVRRGVDVRPMELSDVAIIIAEDKKIFGGDRAAVLEWAFHDAPQYAHAGHSGDAPTHYCFGRRGRLFDQIGPVVAGDERTAQALVAAALDAAGDRPVVVDAFDQHIAFAAWLRSRGFAVQRPLIRMCRRGRFNEPTTPIASSSLVEFAIFGPEFG